MRRPQHQGGGSQPDLPGLTWRVATGLVLTVVGIVLYGIAALSDLTTDLPSLASMSVAARTGLLLIGLGCAIWVTAGLRFLAAGFEPRLRK